MEYRKLGNTDLDISALGFGAMRLPIDPHSRDFSSAVQLIRHAIKRGINYFDVGTFYCYFLCEEAFGLAIKGLKDNIILSGKNSTHQSVDENWTAQLKNTLHQFGRDALDIYFIHYLEKNVWEKYFIEGGVMEQINRARNNGLIKYVGFSSHDAPENVRKLLDTGAFDAVILSFNMLNRTYEDTIQYAHQKGLGVIVMNPLAGGILTNSYLNLHSLTDYFGDTTQAIALNYVFSNPYIHCTLSGMQSASEIDMNIQVAEGRRFLPDESAFINDIITKERNENLVCCTGCNYCMPCPQGIDIIKVIEIWNQYNLIKGKKLFHRDYQILDVTADCCIECGICEEKCPNRIAVSDIMKKVQDLLA